MSAERECQDRSKKALLVPAHFEPRRSMARAVEVDELVPSARLYAALLKCVNRFLRLHRALIAIRDSDRSSGAASSFRNEMRARRSPIA